MLSKALNILILVVLIPLSSMAQEKFPSQFNSNNRGIGMSFGLSNYQLGTTRDALSAEYPESFGPFLLHYGLSYSSGLSVNRKRSFDTHLDIMIYDNHGNSGLTDSMRYSWGGWHFGWDQGFDIFPKVDYIDVIVGLGFNWGRFKLERIVGLDQLSVNSNPFFAPKFILEPRFTFKKRFMVGVRSELTGDITSGAWKKKTNGLDNLGHTRASGFNVMVTLSAYLGGIEDKN